MAAQMVGGMCLATALREVGDAASLAESSLYKARIKNTHQLRKSNDLDRLCHDRAKKKNT